MKFTEGVGCAFLVLLAACSGTPPLHANNARALSSPSPSPSAPATEAIEVPSPTATVPEQPSQTVGSPDGTMVAEATPTRPLASLIIHRRGGPDRLLLTLGGYIDIVAWWPNSQGLLIRPAIGYCNSCAVDGLTLESVALADGVRKPLVIYGYAAGTLDWTNDGRLLVGSEGSRFVVDGNAHVDVCHVRTGTCSQFPRPDGVDDLTPSWSADGLSVAFVRGAANLPHFSLPAVAQGSQLALWVASADGTGARQVTAMTGASYPRWLDRNRIAYVRGQDLWVADLASGTQSRVAGPLVGRQGYGWIDWSKAVMAYPR